VKAPAYALHHQVGPLPAPVCAYALHHHVGPWTSERSHVQIDIAERFACRDEQEAQTTVLRLWAGGLGGDVEVAGGSQVSKLQPNRGRQCMLTAEQAVHMFNLQSTKASATADQLAHKYGVSPRAIHDI